MSNQYKIKRYNAGTSDARLIIKKTEKLTTAVYMITGFFNEKDALKWKLRNEALSFMTFLFEALEGPRARGEEELVGEARRSIRGILALLDLAAGISLISEMNCSILREEYSALYRTILESAADGSPNDFAFPDRFFAPHAEQERESGALRPRGENKGQSKKDTGMYKRHSSPQEKTEERTLALAYGKTSRGDGRDSSSRSGFGSGATQQSSERTATRPEKGGRRERIMQILRTRGEANIKDVSALVPGCSEKTIQRELLSLIALGTVERRGERRWSTYTLR